MLRHNVVRPVFVAVSLMSIALLAACRSKPPAIRATTDVVDAVDAGKSASVQPSARQLLDGVEALMPTDEIFIAGQLRAKNRRGKTERTLNVEMLLNLGEEPSVARYTISDEFGTILERLSISRTHGAAPRYRYKKGDPPINAPLPALNEAIQDTNISWRDLTFSFLWWRNGTVKGRARVKNFTCYVVEVTPPPAEAGTSPQKVRLWITQKHRMLVQAKEYDKEGRATRRLLVKSLKKFDERWMIKDILVESLLTRRKTALRVREMQSLQRKR